MTKNEKKMFLALSRMGGLMIRSVTELMALVPEGEIQDRLKANINDSIEQFNTAADLMEKEWASDEKS